MSLPNHGAKYPVLPNQKVYPVKKQQMKLPKFDEMYKSIKCIEPQRSKNKLKEAHNETHYNQTVKTKRQREL